MIKIAISSGLLLISVMLSGQLYWQDTYFSGQTNTGEKHIRTRAENGMITLYNKTAGIINPNSMIPLNDSFGSYQIQIVNPDYTYIGYKYQGSDSQEILPVYYSGTTTPQLSDLTPLVSDPASDHNFALNNLDMVNTHCTLTNDKLYFSITNDGGGFPVSSGFTYYAYMIALVNPDADSTSNTTVYGLMYTINIAGIISPGLYKITGTGLADMTLIGQINQTVHASENTILMSCNLTDLMADNDFNTWFNPLNPRIGFMAITSKITLVSGNQIADQTSSCTIIPVAVQINNAPATLPHLFNIETVELPTGEYRVSLDYYSDESYFPLVNEIEFNNGHSTSFSQPGFPDWSDSVHYETNIDLEMITGWSSATIRFSNDNIQYTELTIYPVSNQSELNEIQTTPKINLFPNPSYGKLNAEIMTESKLKRIEIYDLKGRKLKTIKTGQADNMVSLDLKQGITNKNLSGIYLLKFVFNNRYITKKIVIQNK